MSRRLPSTQTVACCLPASPEMNALQTLGLAVLAATIIALAHPAQAEEVVNKRIGLPGASLEQKVIYHPSEAEYLRARDAHLEQLRQGNPEAMANPIEGPWMVAETTAMIGIEIDLGLLGLSVGTISAMEGRTNLRQISAAEDALYRYENELD